MKKILVYILLVSGLTYGQTFLVKSVRGKVLVQKGSSEEFVQVHTGDTLSGSDLVLTEPNSAIRLTNGAESFLLDSDAALNVNYLKKISLNDLLLALAMEELKDLPKGKSNGKNTAVYGKEQRTNKSIPNNFSDVIGTKKINGAKLLAANGYRNSAVLLLKETFRKYPSAGRDAKARLFLSDLLYNMKLYDECYSELKSLDSLNLSEKDRQVANNYLDKLNAMMSR